MTTSYSMHSGRPC